MRILVTGAGGFVGSALAKGLQETGGHDVIGLYRTNAPDRGSPDVRWRPGDLVKGLSLDTSIDYIVHCAALRKYHEMPVREFIDANLAMTDNVAAYGKKAGIKGLVFASSVSLHGDVKAEVVDENTDRINPSPYGLSKHLCELLLQEYQDAFPVVALRLCGVVGRGAKDIWLARVLANAMRGEAIGIVNADRPFNNLVHTDDLTRFVLALVKHGFSGFHAFPIGSRTPLSVRDAVREITTAAGSSSEIIDNGVTGNSFMISNDFAMGRFRYEPSDVSTNLKKFARESC